MAGRFIQLYAEEIAHLASAKRASTKKKCGVSGDAWAVYCQIRSHAYNHRTYRKYYCFPSYGGIARNLGWWDGEENEEPPGTITNKVANALMQLEEIGILEVVKDREMRLRIKRAYKLGRTPKTKLYHLVFYKELLAKRNRATMNNQHSQKTMGSNTENYESKPIENYETDPQKTMGKEEELKEEINNLNINKNEETTMPESISVETHGDTPVQELNWLAESIELQRVSGSSYQSIHGESFYTMEILSVIKTQRSAEILKIFGDDEVMQIQEEAPKGSFELTIINQYLAGSGIVQRWMESR
jgi:hypothetical protein